MSPWWSLGPSLRSIFENKPFLDLYFQFSDDSEAKSAWQGMQHLLPELRSLYEILEQIHMFQTTLEGSGPRMHRVLTIIINLSVLVSTPGRANTILVRRFKSAMHEKLMEKEGHSWSGAIEALLGEDKRDRIVPDPDAGVRGGEDAQTKTGAQLLAHRMVPFLYVLAAFFSPARAHRKVALFKLVGTHNRTSVDAHALAKRVAKGALLFEISESARDACEEVLELGAYKGGKG